jgi:threonine/homoserine/homoserine lactone efflux protein
MRTVLLFISAYGMGCLAAIPAGPVQIEVVRRSINNHLKPSLMVVLGAFFADVFYGLIAFFGIAPFLEEKKIMALFWILGGLLLTILSIVIIRHSLNPQEVSYDAPHLKKKRWAFLGGLSLSATNPMMILWWLSGMRMCRDVGLIHDFTPTIALTFLTAGSLGLASYLSILSLVIFWAKQFISLNRLRQINAAFGVFLLLMAAYFIYTSIHTLSRLT